MAVSFFELVNERFFSPLTSVNKEINLEILRYINDKMDNEIRQYSREDVLSWIEEYLENTHMVFIDDETGDDEGKDHKTIASNKIRYFISCGWLVDENDNKTLKTTYQMDNNAIIILNAMDEIVKNDTRPLEYTGYVRNVYALLKSFQDERATETVEQMYRSTKELIDRLRGLTVHIKRYLKKLVSNDKLTPREILQQFLVEYQDKVILKTFTNLRIKDNPSKYKNYIIEQIDLLLEEDNFNKLVEEYISTKKNGVASEENIAEAQKFFNESLDYISKQFQYIADNLEQLNRKNTKYATTAQSRLNFLMNESADIEGQIIELLKNIADTNDMVDNDSPFNLFDFGKIDERSLYQPRTNKRTAVSVVEDTETTIDEVALKCAQERLLNETKYNCFNINKFIMVQLGNKDRIEAKDMRIQSFEDVLRVFLAGLYSDNKIVKYKITYTGTTFVWNDKVITNFIVERK